MRMPISSISALIRVYYQIFLFAIFTKKMGIVNAILKILIEICFIHK